MYLSWSSETIYAEADGGMPAVATEVKFFAV